MSRERRGQRAESQDPNREEPIRAQGLGFAELIFSGFSCEEYIFPYPGFLPDERTTQDPLIFEILFFLLMIFLPGVAIFAYALPFTVLSLQMFYGKEIYGKINSKDIYKNIINFFN